MALECAHCGHRCDDDAARCPKCLRTQLLTVSPEPPKPRRLPLAVIAIFAISGLTATLAVLNARNRDRMAAADASVPAPPSAHPDARDPLAVGSELQPLIARLREHRDPTSRARAAAEAISQRRRAAVFTEDDPIPPPRAPELVWRLLPSARERFSELDLARLITAVLRAAGDGAARVVERLSAARPDEPADPTASLGSYGVLVADHLVDLATATLLPARDNPHRALDDAALGAAISSQAALELATSGGPRARALEYAGAAVEASRDAPMALAARARVWIEAGGSGGLSLAEADLQAAVSQRDDPALHLARARLLVLQGRVGEAYLSAARASRRAPAWGTAALALLALRGVERSMDAGALDGCAVLRASRAPWTDDAYALCAEGVTPAVRTQAARRLYEGARDPLRVAWAASALDATSVGALRDRVRASQRRELRVWLLLYGRADLAALASDAPDAGR